MKPWQSRRGLSKPVRCSAAFLRTYQARRTRPEAVLRVERLMRDGRPSYDVYLDLSYLEDVDFQQRLRFDFDAYAPAATNVGADSD